VSRAIAPHDADKRVTGLIHKMTNGRHLTAKRNRQTVKTACGKMAHLALPVPEPVDEYGDAGVHCLSCWPARPTMHPNFDPEVRVLEEVTELLREIHVIHEKLDKILKQLGQRVGVTVPKRRI
jgi:hypothetical protein